MSNRATTLGMLVLVLIAAMATLMAVRAAPETDPHLNPDCYVSALPDGTINVRMVGGQEAWMKCAVDLHDWFGRGSFIIPPAAARGEVE